MKPWSHDASELNLNDISSAYIYKNQIIEEYLEPHSHERKLFLIGAKGCGKTLLLRYKAYLYWKKLETDEQPGYTVSASNELVESLDFHIDTLSRKELENLSKLQVWNNIWDFALTLVVLRRLKVELPPKLKEVEKDFPSYFRLSNIVSELMTNQSKYITSNFFRTYLNHLSALLNSIRSPFVLFVDRLDQALDTLLSSEEYKYHDSETVDNIPFKVWQNAQCGLLLSSYNFTTATNRHIKIFATARREALDVNTQLMANVTGYCTYLEYSKEELKEIFEKNIHRTPKKLLDANVLKQNPFQAFFGFEEMPHLQAKSENGEFQIENVFDFLLRHTFERPREVVLMGRHIYDQLLTRTYRDLGEEKKIEKVRAVVNKTSHDFILKNYLKEVIPSFRHEYLDECAKVFSQNLIEKDDFFTLDREIIDYLYRIGLVGYVQQQRQSFLPASKYIHDYDESIPIASYYMLHPSLDHKFQQKQDFHDFYNEYCIIGNGYPFHSPPIYINHSKKNLDIAHYLPKEYPGKGSSEDAWEKSNIKVSLEELYRSYFIEEDNPERKTKSHKVINDAMKVMTVVSNLKAIELLRRHYNLSDNEWREWEEELKEQLEKLKKTYKYTAQINGLSNNNLDHFEGRIFGRLIAAGMLVYLDTDYLSVKQVLQQFIIDKPKNANGEDVAVRFLRQAFFLAYLPNVVPKYDNERRKLLRHLSDFEQKLLRRWWLHYTEHVVFEKEYLQDKHINYLKSLMKLTH